MTDLPKVIIVLLTCHRLDYALRTVQGVCDHLQYHDLSWYVAVDSDDQSHLKAILELLEKNDAQILGYHAREFVSDKRWPGKSWNLAWETAHEESPLVLWLENDFVLQRPLNIDPYVKLLMDNDKVGMVRLGHLAIDLNMTSMGHAGIHYMQMWRNMPYAFSGNPSLRHHRFAQTYGPYKEDIQPGDTEVEYDARFRSMSGPEIWWPVDLGGWGIFSHIGQEQSYQ